jgi:hypothetical protein
MRHGEDVDECRGWVRLFHFTSFVTNTRWTSPEVQRRISLLHGLCISSRYRSRLRIDDEELDASILRPSRSLAGAGSLNEDEDDDNEDNEDEDKDKEGDGGDGDGDGGDDEGGKADGDSEDNEASRGNAMAADFSSFRNPGGWFRVRRV